jgi:hypothetical protein
MRNYKLKPKIWTFYLSVFLLPIVSCSTKNRKAQQDEIESRLKIKTDSVYRVATSKYKISYRLDTLQYSHTRTTLFYQENIKDGDNQLIELERYEISDVHKKDGIYYLVIWDNSSSSFLSSILVEVSFDPKDLQKLLDWKTHALLIVNINRIEKIHFEMEAKVSEADPSTDYYAIDLNLKNARKVFLKGSVKEIYFY